MQRPAACIMDLYGKAAATFVKTAFADFDSVGVSLKVTLICHFQTAASVLAHRLPHSPKPPSRILTQWGRRMKRKEEIQNDGFTLAELLIVVAIIGVLVAIAIPIFSSQLEKSREATDLANVRSKYAELMAEAITNGGEGAPYQAEVPLKQKQDDWQGYDPVELAGITHYKWQSDTDQWKGVPGPGGKCTITYDEKDKVIFNWSGGTGISDRVDTTAKDFDKIHNKAQELMNRYGSNNVFEIDSRCPNSSMVPVLKEVTEADNLFRSGTWAYLADPQASKVGTGSNYFIWTSMDTAKAGAGKKIPVIVCRKNADGTYSYYVTDSETGSRTKGSKEYVAVSKTIPNAAALDQAFTKGKAQDCQSFEEAYQAYQKKISEEYAEHIDWIDDNLK